MKMKRKTFIESLASLALVAVPTLVGAQNTGIAVLVSSSEPDTNDELTDSLCRMLRANGVHVVDPSSAQQTYHEKGKAAAVVDNDFAAVSSESASWIEQKFSSARVMLVSVKYHSSSLPYGDFKVDFVRAVASYRCFNVRSKQILSAGRAEGQGHGEDQDHAKEVAAQKALSGIAQQCARDLS